MIKSLLEGNRRFLANEYTTHLDYYKSIAQSQSPTVLWIGCSDSRVSESVITDSMPGTIFVHRNVANIVSFNDVNIAAIVTYAVNYLHIPDIVICGHTRCGGIAALDADLHDPYIADWLLIASGARDAVNRIAAGRPLSAAERHRLLVEENVKLQIRHLQDLSIIKYRRPEELVPRIHGWVYDVDTGRIEVLVDGAAPGER
jgi:carbonic anhydrase